MQVNCRTRSQLNVCTYYKQNSKPGTEPVTAVNARIEFRPFVLGKKKKACTHFEVLWLRDFSRPTCIFFHAQWQH